MSRRMTSARPRVADCTVSASHRLVVCSWNSSDRRATRALASSTCPKNSSVSSPAWATSNSTAGRSWSSANTPCISKIVLPSGLRLRCTALTTVFRSCRFELNDAWETCLPSRLRASSRASRSCLYTDDFFPRSLCRSRQKTPRPHSWRRRFTTSNAAVFSLTKSTRFPSASSVAMMFAIV